MQVQLQVVGSSFRGQESLLDLGLHTLRARELDDESTWKALPVFFLPKDQPNVEHPMSYKLRVKQEGGDELQGVSETWQFQEEQTVDAVPEIAAEFVGKFHEDSQVRSVPERADLLAQGGEAEIWNTHQVGDVVRLLKPGWWQTFSGKFGPRDAQAVGNREFLKDVCMWKRISEKCGGRVAQFKGWFLVLDRERPIERPPVAGFRLKGMHPSCDRSVHSITDTGIG